MKKLTKPLFIALGFLAFAVGTVGIFLPVLPTTPLYLLTLFCFTQGSERLRGWFVSTSLYKKHLDGFVRDRAMTLKTKLFICVPMTFMLTAAFIFAPIWHARVFIAAVLLFKWWYFFFRIRTIKTIPAAEAPALGIKNQYQNKGCSGK